MEAVPIGYYLARKSRENGALSADPNRLDIQSATEAWYQKGLAEGLLQAKEACDAAILRQQEECRLHIAAARRAWSETEGALLARQIGEAAANLQDDIASSAARILKPLVAKEIADRAIAKLASELEKLFSHADAIHLKISGPADLVCELRTRIPKHISVVITESDSQDVAVFVNKTTIETRLNEWFSRIGVHDDDKGREP